VCVSAQPLPTGAKNTSPRYTRLRPFGSTTPFCSAHQARAFRLGWLGSATWLSPLGALPLLRSVPACRRYWSDRFGASPLGLPSYSGTRPVQGTGRSSLRFPRLLLCPAPSRSSANLLSHQCSVAPELGSTHQPPGAGYSAQPSCLFRPIPPNSFLRARLLAISPSDAQLLFHCRPCGQRFWRSATLARRCKVISRSMLSYGPRHLRSAASLVLGRSGARRSSALGRSALVGALPLQSLGRVGSWPLQSSASRSLRRFSRPVITCARPLS